MTSSFAEARAWAADWAQRWFLDAAGTDRLQIDGLDAGWATHVEAYGLLFRFALERLGSAPRRTSPSLLQTVKELGLDRAARTAGLRLLRAPGVETVPVVPGGRVAFVVEIPTPSILHPVAAVARVIGTPGAIVATADPRAYRGLAAAGLRPVALTVPWRDERSLLRRAQVSAEVAWAPVRTDPPIMELGGEDVAIPALGVLLPLLTRSLPWLGVEVAAVRRLLERTRPISIAIGSDQHRIGRVVAQVAGEVGIPAVVLQHGLPQARIGLLPVVAPTVAAWSEASRDWFVEHGTAPGAVAVTGNPRLDEFWNSTASGAAASVPGVTRLRGRPRILLALSPGAPTDEAVLRLALDGLASLPEACMVAKLHPGQGDWGFVKPVLAGHPAAQRVRVLRHEPLYPLLRWADVTLVQRSTVAVESLAAGTPVGLLATAEAPGAADLELGDLRLPRADSGDSLADLIVSLGSSRESYFSERAAALQRIVGPLDGRSAERIAALLLKGSSQR